MNLMNESRLIWLDLETTGLSPQHDSIIEIGVIITDWTGGEIASQSLVVRPGNRPLTEISPIVLEMHVRNGLWHECLGGNTVSRSLAEDHVADFITEHRAEGSLVCGSTVGFDRQFIKLQMPKVDRLFHYRSLDMSTLNSMAARLNPKLYEQRPQSESNHRAISDLWGSIALYRYYVDKLFGGFEALEK